MKYLLPAALILCLLFSGCSDRANKSSQEIKASTMDSNGVTQMSIKEHNIMLKEPLFKSMKHYFSDTAHMDSFALALPAGDLYSNTISLRIYNSASELIFMDSIAPASFFIGDTVVDKDGFVQADAGIADVKRGFAQMLTDTFISSFTNGSDSQIKDAQTGEIMNMIGWNEAMADTSKIVYRYFDYYRGTSFVFYSHKLKRAVTIVHIENEEDD